MTNANASPSTSEQRARQQEAAKTLKEHIKKRKKLYKNLLDDQEKFRRAINSAPELELIKQNLHRVKRGDTFVEVMDYSAQTPISRRIPLPNKPLKEFVEKSFLAIKRGLKGLKHLKPRLEALQDEIAGLEDELSRTLSDDFFLQEPSSLLNEEIPKTISTKTKIRLPYKIFLSKDGIPIWVAKSAKDGDQMTLKHSRGNEWWLHVKDNTGAHVLVKYSLAIPKETLLDAAHLALYFSKMKTDSKGEVLYTQVKHLKKLKGMKPGQISVQKEKNIYLSIEKDRLERLLSSLKDAL